MELRPYQVEGVEFLRSNDRAYLGDEMGLGKSAQLVRASEGSTLVVAPAMIIDSGTWTNEITRWSDDPGRFAQASYSSLTRRNGRSVTGDLLPDLDRHWDTVILDEAHYIKNSKAIRTKAIKDISRLADRMYLASGTPIPNWPHELFVPLQLLFPSDATPGNDYGSKWRWIDEWFRTKPNQYSNSVYAYDVLGLRGCTPACSQRSPLDPCEHYHRFVRENLGDSFLQRLRDDVLTDLPPLTRQVITLPMAPAQDKEYASMAKDFIAQVDDEEVVAWSSSAKNTILDRITTGLGVVAAHSPNKSNKFEMLREDLSERYRPTLVAAHYKNSVEAAVVVAHELGRRVAFIHGGTRPVDRQRIVTEFQSGQLDVLVGSLDTIAEGLTLTAADMLIQIETSYKPTRNQQVARRIHRLGQDRPCTVREYVSTRKNGKPCLDGNKRDLVDSKTDTQIRTLTAARFKELL